jgi:hypothetical protein
MIKVLFSCRNYLKGVVLSRKFNGSGYTVYGDLRKATGEVAKTYDRRVPTRP